MTAKRKIKATLRDRIKELRRVKASELLRNPWNWREHPDDQKSVMKKILQSVGIANALIARETPKGLKLIDGHLRADIDPKSIWPVLILDITDDEEKAILATMDNVGTMAGINDDALHNLIMDIPILSDDLLKDLFLPIDLDFGLIPDSILKNKKHLEEIKQQRKSGNDSVVDKNDTEKYLIVVYSSRQQKNAALRKLGLPAEERYIPSSTVSIRRRMLKTFEKTDRKIKSAPKKKAGANG